MYYSILAKIWKYSKSASLRMPWFHSRPFQMGTVIHEMRLAQVFFNLQAPLFLYIGQAFRYSPENAFYLFNQQIYFIIWYLLDRASLI